MRGLTAVRWLIVMGLAGLLGAGCARGAPPAPTGTPTAQPVVAPTLPPTPMPSPVPPTAQPTPTPSAAPPTAQPTPTAAPLTTATMTILYDNVPYREGWQTAWGYACLLWTDEATILFDTGGDGALLLANMAALGVEPASIEAVVLSHVHADHTAGLAELLSAGARPIVYLPASFPDQFKREVASQTRLVEVTGPVEVSPGVYSTGEVGSDILEQALAVRTAEGLVVITGCAHPGVVEMVRAAQQVANGGVSLLMGGFHLQDAGQPEIERVIQDLRGLDVRRVAPSHCTGERARWMFAEAFGEACLPAGLGWGVSVGLPPRT